MIGSLRRWGLTAGEPLAGGLVGHVIACRDEHGEDLVLKLAGPTARPDLEAAALRHWAGRRAATLVDADPSQGALLLRRVRPGTPLAPGDDERATPAVAAVIESLHGAPDAAGGFPSLPERLEAYFERKRAAADAHSDLGFWAATHPPADRLLQRAMKLAGRTGRDPERGARWAAVWAVGEACDGPPEQVQALREWLRGEEARRLLTTQAERTL
jgi:streptomycin 6-kinase